MKKTTLALLSATGLLAAGFSTGTFAADKYTFDKSHTQLIFSYNHLGFSTTYGTFKSMDGELMLDMDAPEKSSIKVTIDLMSMDTFWEGRDKHFSSPDIMDVANFAEATFTSTNVEVTGADTAKVTGDLDLHGVTKPVVLDVKLNKSGKNRGGKDQVGFDATASFNRSDFGLDLAVPYVGDEVKLMISTEMVKAD